jgi:predicted transcriptional regulator
MSGFPKALRALRTQYFSKQLALAAACECSTAYISWLESGKRCPSCAMLRKLKQALIVAHAGDREIADLLAQAQIEMIRKRFEGLS